MKQFSLEEYLRDSQKKIITRDGKSARIICTNKKDERYPVVALVQDKNSNCEKTHHYTIGGKCIIEDDNSEDLFFAPEKKERWVNIYKTPDGNIHLSEIYTSKEVAEASAKNCVYYITTTKIEWEEEQ